MHNISFMIFLFLFGSNYGGYFTHGFDTQNYPKLKASLCTQPQNTHGIQRQTCWDKGCASPTIEIESHTSGFPRTVWKCCPTKSICMSMPVELSCMFLTQKYISFISPIDNRSTYCIIWKIIFILYFKLLSKVMYF